MTAGRTVRLSKKAAVVCAGIGMVHIPERLVGDEARLGHSDSWRPAPVYPQCSLAVLMRYQKRCRLESEHDRRTDLSVGSRNLRCYLKQGSVVTAGGPAEDGVSRHKEIVLGKKYGKGRKEGRK